MRQLGSAVILALCVLPAAAAAQAKEIPKKLTITPPAGWQWTDPVSLMKKGRALARSLGVSIGRKPPVAYFAAKTPFQGVTANLNIREVENKVLDINDRAVAQYRRTLSRGIGPFKVKIDRLEATSAAGRQVLRAEWTYNMRGIPLRAVQVMYPGRASTFISTYTVHAGQWPAQQSQINASIESFRSLEPWYLWFVKNKWITIGMGAGVLFALLLLVSRLRRSA